MTRSKNVKCGKVKFFMRLLAMQGYIEKTPSNQNNLVRVGRKTLCKQGSRGNAECLETVK